MKRTQPLEEAIRSLDKCPYCLEGRIEALTPEYGIVGVYSKCRTCGALGAIACDGRGRLYLSWIRGEDSIA